MNPTVAELIKTKRKLNNTTQHNQMLPYVAKCQHPFISLVSSGHNQILSIKLQKAD